MEICRACLIANDPSYSIHDEVIKQAFLDLVGITVKANDSLPQSVCGDCAHRLEEFYSFRRKVLTSNTFLLEALIEEVVKPPEPALVTLQQIKEEEIKTEPLIDVDSGNYSDNEQEDKGFEITANYQQITNRTHKNRKSKSRIKTHPSRRAFIKIDPKKINIIKLNKDEQKLQILEESRNPVFLAMPYRCDKCYKGFNYERKLNAHNEKYHKEDSKFQCDVCSKTLANSSSLAVHVQRHELLYECCKCLKRFVEKNQAISHYRSVHEGLDVQIPCKICGRVFRHRSTLNGHMRNHHPKEDRPSCNICNKIFVSKDSLEDHMLIHTGEKNYPCDKCGKCFRLKSEVKVHQRSHSNDRPFYCVPCDALFKSHASYSNHLKHTRVHIQPEQLLKHRCPDCSRTFPSAPALRAHVAVHGNNREQCPQCAALLSSAAALRKHIRRHNRPQSRDHVCHECADRFTSRRMLENHIRTHTGEKPFCCADCTARFSQKSTLRTHVKLVHLKIRRNAKHI